MKKWLKSFNYALAGLKYVLLNERNFKIHAFCFLLVIVFSLVFKVSSIEFFILLICSAIVFSSEAINTAIEKILDENNPEHKPEIGLIKDISAAAVLICAVFSAIIAAFIFIPKIFQLLF